MRNVFMLLFLIPSIFMEAQEVSKIAVGVEDSLTVINMTAVSSTTGEHEKDYKKILDSLWYNGEFETAIQYLSTLIKIDSLNLDLYCYLGDIKSLEYPNDTSFLSDYRDAIKLDPNNIWAHYKSGFKYLSLFDPDYNYIISRKDSAIYRYDEFYVDKAIYHFEKVLQIDSTFFFNLRNRLIDLYILKGQIWKAKNIESCNYTFPIDTDSLNVPLNLKAYYFPIEFLIDTINIYLYETVVDDDFLKRRTELAHWVNNWYSEQLYALKEPLLNNGYFKHEVYRFTWLRSFDKPIAIRIEKDNNQYKLTAKLSDRDIGYILENIIISSEITINEIQWALFVDLINKIDFWNISPIENIHGMEGYDGARWILEGLKDNNYHMIDRWDGKDKETGEACLYLLELSGLKIKKEDIY